MSTTTKAPTFKVRLGLNVWTENRDGYFHSYATVVQIGKNAWEQRCTADGSDDYADIRPDTVRNVARQELVGGLLLDNVRVSAQGNNDNAERHLYGWDIAYRDSYKIELRDAERMAKTLKTIHARMNRIDEQTGRATTFGGFLARFATAVGANAMLTARRENAQWHRDSDYQWFSILDGVYHVDRTIADWIKAGKVAAVA